MKRKYIRVLMFFSFSSLMGFTSPNFEEGYESTLASDLLAQARDPVDGHWLPNLTGLPDKNQVALISKHIADLMMEEEDSKCRSIDVNLRMMVFEQFAIHQQMANAQHIYFDQQSAYKWAHVLGMILKESSGDSTSITDMSGRSLSTYKSQTNLQRWKKILSVSIQSRIKMNYQTNFGLTQTSADRLFVAFSLAKNLGYNTDFLVGKHGALTKRMKKVGLNTAIAIRRLIWFYQDFAQGRVVQSDKRIHLRDIKKPRFLQQYQMGLESALLYCGTFHMFHERHPIPGITYSSKLENAMSSIAYCKLGNVRSGYGKNEFDEKCFASWVTLCPALNVDIALLTPLSYFATRSEKPVCVKTFQRLINKRPDESIH